jgi:hypothetical protein
MSAAFAEVLASAAAEAIIQIFSRLSPLLYSKCKPDLTRVLSPKSHRRSQLERFSFSEPAMQKADVNPGCRNGPGVLVSGLLISRLPHRFCPAENLDQTVALVL